MKNNTKLEITDDFLHRLPKTDLHVHLDGSLRLSTILELAEERGVTLPADTAEGLAESISMGRKCEDLTDYLKGFDVNIAVRQSQSQRGEVVVEDIRGKPFAALLPHAASHEIGHVLHGGSPTHILEIHCGHPLVVSGEQEVGELGVSVDQGWVCPATKPRVQEGGKSMEFCSFDTRQFLGAGGQVPVRPL